MNLDTLKWDEKGLISAIFQDAETGEVYTLAHMNREALQKTLETGRAWLYRRSHGRVMKKGETSGREQIIRDVFVDCDSDCLLFKIEQIGGAACHTGHRTCFYWHVEEGEVVETGERVFEVEEVYGSTAG